MDRTQLPSAGFIQVIFSGECIIYHFVRVEAVQLGEDKALRTP